MGTEDGVVWFLRVSERDQGTVRILTLEGRISNATIGQLRDRLGSGPNGQARHVVLDLAGVDYLNGDGLRLLEAIAMDLNGSGGELAVCGLQPVLRSLFDLAGPIPHLSIDASLDAATERMLR